MSGSTEIPDVLGGITNALGVKHLWDTEEQLDSEKHKPEEAEQRKKEESLQTKKTDHEDERRGVVPVSLKKEKEGERESELAEGKKADHDVEIHGVLRLRNSPKQIRNGYEWPTPASLTNDQTKRKYGSEPPGDEEPPCQGVGTSSKPPWMGSILPPLKEQKNSFVESPPPTSPQTAPCEIDNPFDRPRPQSLSSQRNFERLKPPRRQFTAPDGQRRGSESQESSRTRAKSRWVAAAHGLRFPLRRRTTELRRITETRGRELINSLVAGAPAASLLALHMIPDERSHHRIPVIVDLLKVSILTSCADNRLT